MNRRQLFLELLEKAGRLKLVFTDHFRLRKAARGVGEGAIEDLLFNRKQDLIYVQEDENKGGRPRFRAFYGFTKRKALLNHRGHRRRRFYTNHYVRAIRQKGPVGGDEECE